ncbi:unnamed protein product [Caenorhabditis auriculariae]|uniref:Uncharacterized protein n=1 Tax=Caenorhabditis auriculariae TaxID=2777116 RepID=A0A8S1HMY4_9PELO|nr:unnamed protein product [Caenorhabditis auriculariae]
MGQKFSAPPSPKSQSNNNDSKSSNPEATYENVHDGKSSGQRANVSSQSSSPSSINLPPSVEKGPAEAVAKDDNSYENIDGPIEAPKEEHKP